jgi:hypothetical protein
MLILLQGRRRQGRTTGPMSATSNNQTLEPSRHSVHLYVVNRTNRSVWWLGHGLDGQGTVRFDSQYGHQIIHHSKAVLSTLQFGERKVSCKSARRQSYLRSRTHTSCISWPTAVQIGTDCRNLMPFSIYLSVPIYTELTFTRQHFVMNACTDFLENPTRFSCLNMVTDRRGVSWPVHSKPVRCRELQNA